MYTFDFNQKIKRLNPELYVVANTIGLDKGQHRSTGIYCKRAKRTKTAIGGADMHVATSMVQGYLRAHAEGSLDEYIEGIPAEFVPEYDIFDLELGTMIAKGWRTAVLSLVKRGYCDLARARRIFSPSLGEADYDKWGFEKRLQVARDEALWRRKG